MYIVAFLCLGVANADSVAVEVGNAVVARSRLWEASFQKKPGTLSPVF
jgi:uncharacterized membrane protein